MNKALLLISLLVANLQALPETMGAEQKPFPFTPSEKRDLPLPVKLAMLTEKIEAKKEPHFPSKAPSSEESKKNSEESLKQTTIEELLRKKEAKPSPFNSGPSRFSFIRKNYDKNEITIQITSTKADNLIVCDVSGSRQEVCVIAVEDSDKKIAEITIVRREKDFVTFSIKVESSYHYANQSESFFGTVSGSDDFRVTYSKNQDDVYITIPFNFIRKPLPVEIKN